MSNIRARNIKSENLYQERIKNNQNVCIRNFKKYNMNNLISFDQSTIFYANEFINWLKRPTSESKNFLKILADAFSHRASYPEDGIIVEACQRVSECYHGGIYSLTGVGHDNPNIMNLIVQLIFGVLCLEKVTMGICLGSNTCLLPSPSSIPGIKFSFCGKNFYKEDEKQLKKVWCEPSIKDEDKADYASWLEKFKHPENQKLANEIKEITGTALSLPFLRLGEYLADVSSGIIEHVLVREQHSPIDDFFGTFTYKNLYFFNDLNYTPYKNQVLTSRLFPYLLNAFCYKYISNKINATYICNDYREPFLNIMTLSTKNFDTFSRIKSGIKFALFDEANELDNMGGQVEQIPDLGYLLLSSAIFDAKSVNDLLPAIYRLRNKLAPVREYFEASRLNIISRNDVKEINNLITHRSDENDFGFEMKVMQVKVSNSWFKWLYHEVWSIKNPHLAILVSLKDRYRNASCQFGQLAQLMEIA